MEVARKSILSVSKDWQCQYGFNVWTVGFCSIIYLRRLVFVWNWSSRSGANNRKSSGEQVRLESDIETLRTVRMEIRSWPSQDIAEMTSDQEKVLRSALRSVDSVATRKTL